MKNYYYKCLLLFFIYCNNILYYGTVTGSLLNKFNTNIMPKKLITSPNNKSINATDNHNGTKSIKQNLYVKSKSMLLNEKNLYSQRKSILLRILCGCFVFFVSAVAYYVYQFHKLDEFTKEGPSDNRVVFSSICNPKFYIDYNDNNNDFIEILSKNLFQINTFLNDQEKLLNIDLTLDVKKFLIQYYGYVNIKEQILKNKKNIDINTLLDFLKKSQIIQFKNGKYCTNLLNFLFTKPETLVRYDEHHFFNQDIELEPLKEFLINFFSKTFDKIKFLIQDDKFFFYITYHHKNNPFKNKYFELLKNKNKSLYQFFSKMVPYNFNIKK